MTQGADIGVLTRTAYWCGPIGRSVAGPVSFAPDGRVTGRDDPAMVRYRLGEDGDLTLLSQADEETAVLQPIAGGGFGPRRGAAHFLHPIVSLDAAPVPARPLPRVFINTSPKAGTYLLARALEIAGFTNDHLHVMDDFFDDNRGVPAEDIHWQPGLRRQACPARVAASLIRPGTFMVGHLYTAQAIQSVAAEGVTVLNVVRDPRTQIVSMHAFKKAKVKPSPADQIWQSMTGLDAFKAFLISQPLRLWVRQTRQMLKQDNVLQFDALKRGEFSCNAFDQTLNQQITAALQQALGSRTSTYLPRTDDPTSGYLNDPAVTAYLTETGVLKLARKHWPDAT